MCLGGTGQTRQGERQSTQPGCGWELVAWPRSLGSPIWIWVPPLVGTHVPFLSTWDLQGIRDGEGRWLTCVSGGWQAVGGEEEA